MLAAGGGRARGRGVSYRKCHLQRPRGVNICDTPKKQQVAPLQSAVPEAEEASWVMNTKRELSEGWTVKASVQGLAVLPIKTGKNHSWLKSCLLYSVGTSLDSHLENANPPCAFLNFSSDQFVSFSGTQKDHSAFTLAI